MTNIAMVEMAHRNRWFRSNPSVGSPVKKLRSNWVGASTSRRAKHSRELMGRYVRMVKITLNNISQIGSSSQLLGKIKNVPNH